MISSLALEGTYVLRRGDLEVYCGTVAESEKVNTAIAFCNNTSSLEELKRIHGTNGDSVVEELRRIFSSIYCEDKSAEFEM